MSRTSIGVLLEAFAEHDQRVAITHAQGDWSYAELLTRIHRMARALRSQGVRRGQVIALLTGNRPETFVLRCATHVLGATAAVLYERLTDEQLIELLRAAEVATLVFPTGPEAERALAALRAVPGAAGLTLGPQPGVVDLAALAEAESAEPVPVDAQVTDVATIRLTGGSTGTPKRVPYDFRVPGYFAPAALAAWQDATQLLCTPVGHLAGTLADVLLAAGGRVVLQERFDPVAVLEAIERERVTYLWLPANLLPPLLDVPGMDAIDVSGLRAITLGGGASSARQLARAVDRFGAIIAQGYGANEIGQVTMLTAEEHRKPELLTTAGRPVPGIELSIRDAEGEPVDTGVAGEIWVRGPQMMPGYFKDPERTAKALRDGWFHSGDLGFRDAAGYLTVVGRSTDGPCARAVEQALTASPDVQSALAFEIADPEGGEQVCVAVVPAPGSELSEQDIQSRVADDHGFVSVLILDALPTSGSGKPDRVALQRLYRSIS
ncbi:fatty acid--CoA ligase [Pseudonocardiaceae bacterium YIM PH 21723]|nr:fatty acid--CoA ligase [Pseudonocardiaceae bacterium YIM PH 21723]